MQAPQGAQPELCGWCAHTRPIPPSPLGARTMTSASPTFVFLPAHHSHKFAALRTCIASHSQKYDARVIWNLMWCIILCWGRIVEVKKLADCAKYLAYQLLSMTCVHYYALIPLIVLEAGKIIFIIPWCKNLHRLETFKFVGKNKSFSMINIYLAENKNIFQPLVVRGPLKHVNKIQLSCSWLKKIGHPIFAQIPPLQNLDFSRKIDWSKSTLLSTRPICSIC